jgi:hypothetical protein
MTSVRRYRVKLAAIHMKGGMCQECKKTFQPNQYEFHHRDGEEKDFTLSSVANMNWEFVKNELKKCDLLCVYCHRLKHPGLFADKVFMEFVNNYRGELLAW